MTPIGAVDAFAGRHRYHLLEALPWLAAVATYFVFPDYLALGAQILATILFALSADLVLGYAGIVTLGHAAFFGTGAYIAGILAAHGWGSRSPAFLPAQQQRSIGFPLRPVVLRTTGLALLMQTLVVATMVAEAATRPRSLRVAMTGCRAWKSGRFSDGSLRPVRPYSLFLLPDRALLCWLTARHIVHSPFGGR